MPVRSVTGWLAREEPLLIRLTDKPKTELCAMPRILKQQLTRHCDLNHFEEFSRSKHFQHDIGAPKELSTQKELRYCRPLWVILDNKKVRKGSSVNRHSSCESNHLDSLSQRVVWQYIVSFIPTRTRCFTKRRCCSYWTSFLTWCLVGQVFAPWYSKIRSLETKACLSWIRRPVWMTPSYRRFACTRGLLIHTRCTGAARTKESMRSRTARLDRRLGSISAESISKDLRIVSLLKLLSPTAASRLSVKAGEKNETTESHNRRARNATRIFKTAWI